MKRLAFDLLWLTAIFSTVIYTALFLLSSCGKVEMRQAPPTPTPRPVMHSTAALSQGAYNKITSRKKGYKSTPPEK